MPSYLPTLFEQFIHLSRYSRWLPEQNRRETWEETVHRYFDFFEEHLKVTCGYDVPASTRKELENAVLTQQVMPSMRCLMTAGEALKRDNAAAFNCSALAVDDQKVFSETLYLLMCGCGVGFSCERQFINKLPEIAEEFFSSDTTIVVPDTRVGWCKSLRELISLLYQGQVPKFDFTQIRPAGSPLKTFGGRSSGADVLRQMFQKLIVLWKTAAGRKLTSLEVHDAMCIIAESVVVGGVRRASLISLSNLSDDRMRSAKSGQWWIDAPHRALANNSAVYTDKAPIGVFMKEWLALYESKSGERGIFNRASAQKQAQKFGRREHKGVEFLTNPCLSADTLVYVADGRPPISIKKLAEEGMDVPVFCFDDNGKVVVRTMRNPRQTGFAQLLEIELEGGHKIKVTHNHKFLLSDGTYKCAQDLVVGTSLKTLCRNIVRKRSARTRYWGLEYVRDGKVERDFEHRAIHKFYTGGQAVSGWCTHHKDFNGLNNAADNLVRMASVDHAALHGRLVRGEANPMRRAKSNWSKERWDAYKLKLSENSSGVNNWDAKDVSHHALRSHAIKLTSQLGKRFSHEDWIRYAEIHDLPKSFSKWRRRVLGSISTLAKWAAIESGILPEDVAGLHANTRAKYLKLLRQGYDCDFVDGQFVIHVVCEGCGKSFDTVHREHSFCSSSCACKHRSPTVLANVRRGLKERFSKDRVAKRQAQASVYCGLRVALGTTPKKKEWMKACKENSVSAELCRASSPFRSYKDLQEFAGAWNHRVLAIKPCTPELVYNGTVDDFHNFFVGAWSEPTVGSISTKNTFWSQFCKESTTMFINNLQCGEVSLRPSEMCNLTEVVIRPNDTAESLAEKVRLATILGTWQSTLTDFRFLSPRWKKNCEEERLLGVSLTGIVDNPITCTVGPKLETLLGDLRQKALDVNKVWAAKLQIPTSAAITTVKPSGTVSLLVGAASGIHPRFAKRYVRTVRQDIKDPLTKFMIDTGFAWEPDVVNPEKTIVFSFPVVAPRDCICRNELTAMQQLELWLVYKTYFTEHNVSITVYVREHEWLEVGAWVYKHLDDITGVSFLPHSDHVYKQAPYQEVTAEEFDALVAKTPKEVDWSKLSQYEVVDSTVGTQTLSCTGGVCEL